MGGELGPSFGLLVIGPLDFNMAGLSRALIFIIINIVQKLMNCECFL